MLIIAGKHIVIVGPNFAGVTAAMELVKCLDRHYEIVMVSHGDKIRFYTYHLPGYPLANEGGEVYFFLFSSTALPKKGNPVH